MSARLAFLRGFLPRTDTPAVYYVGINRPPASGDGKGRWEQVECRSVEEVAAVLDREAEQAETYVAPAAFAPGKGRTKKAVIAKDWIEADIDAKAMPGATFEERHANARKLAAAIPVPIVLVDSGGGIQPRLKLPVGDRVQDFPTPAEGVAHVERLAVALRRFVEAKAEELFGARVSLDHAHTAERVWRAPPGWNCKAKDGEKTLTADRGSWRPVRTLCRPEAIADTPAANLEFLAPYLQAGEEEDFGRFGRKPGGDEKGFDPAMLPARLRDRWPLADGDQSDNDYAVGAALAEAGHPPEVAEDAIRQRRAALPDAEDRAKGDRQGYVRNTVEKAYSRARTGRGGVARGRERPKTPWPAPPVAEALHGLAGDLVRIVGPYSEADPVALLVQALAAFGNVVGRGPHFRAEADIHYLKLFLVLVGETSKGRKGTSWGHVERLFVAVDDPWRVRLGSGLSSGEGLIWQVRDPIYKSVAVKEKGRVVGYEDQCVDEGVQDKRLLVIEAEFATALRVLGRDGNTLSAIIRNAWDRDFLQSMTKNSPAKSTGAHISIVGHITRNELLRYLTTTEAGNGYGNRHLWVCVRRSKLLPEGGRVPDDVFADLVVRFGDVVAFARGVREMRRDDAARALWHEVYAELSAGRPGLLGAMTSRAEAQVMRVACLYALLDRSDVVRIEHLRAALALWRYCEDSARYVFGDSLGDPIADEALRLIRDRPAGVDRTAIRDHFGRHAQAGQLDRALAALREAGLVDVRWERTSGRSKEVWFPLGGGTEPPKEPEPGRDKSDQSDKSPPVPDPSVASDAFVAPEDDAHEPEAPPPPPDPGCDKSDQSPPASDGGEAPGGGDDGGHREEF